VTTTATMLLAAALLSSAGPSAVRARAALPARQSRAARPTARGSDPLAVASSLDVLSVCLAAGMAVSTAASATAASAPPRLAQVLRRAADLLALGADPAAAWSTPAGGADPQIDAVLRLARRSAVSGVALADALSGLATQCRQDAVHAATATAERAGVLIAGPLGLCFLPAFVCLGIVPVIAGLADDFLQSGLW